MTPLTVDAPVSDDTCIEDLLSHCGFAASQVYPAFIKRILRYIETFE